MSMEKRTSPAPSSQTARSNIHKEVQVTAMGVGVGVVRGIPARESRLSRSIPAGLHYLGAQRAFHERGGGGLCLFWGGGE